MDAISAIGAVMLSAATLPQALRLLRERSARGFAWPFVLLNLVGLILLASRSGEIGEWSFLAVNLIGAAFWLLVFAVKAFDEARGDFIPPRAPPVLPQPASQGLAPGAGSLAL